MQTIKLSEYFLNDFTDILSHIFLQFMINILKGDLSFILGSTIVDLTLKKHDTTWEGRSLAECIFEYVSISKTWIKVCRVINYKYEKKIMWVFFLLFLTSRVKLSNFCSFNILLWMIKVCQIDEQLLTQQLWLVEVEYMQQAASIPILYY